MLESRGGLCSRAEEAYAREHRRRYLKMCAFVVFRPPRIFLGSFFGFFCGSIRRGEDPEEENRAARRAAARGHHHPPWPPSEGGSRTRTARRGVPPPEDTITPHGPPRRGARGGNLKAAG